MQTIPITEVIVPRDRQRKTFDVEDLDELRTSILSKGLLHPIVLRNDGRTLVAGERRLRAVKSIYGSNRSFECNGDLVPSMHIPFIRLGDLSVVDIREAELEENTRRVDIPWQERAQAVAELHQMRLDQNPKHTATATASEIMGRKAVGGEVQRVVLDNVLVARALSDPDVAKAPNQTTALRIARRKAEAAHRADLAAELQGSRPTSGTFIHGDAAEELPKLEANTFSCIITDPPYGMSAGKFGSGQLAHGYDDTEDYSLAMYELLFKEGYRVTTTQAHLYAFVHINRFNDVAESARSHGWATFPTPLIWIKGTAANTAGHFPWQDRGPRRTYEAILYACKGNRPLVEPYADSIGGIGPVRDRDHPAEKPVELFSFLLNKSCRPGDYVLDPFCGSGNVFVAARNRSLYCTGIELDERYAAIARSKL